jgi:hypothetical protein
MILETIPQLAALTDEQRELLAMELLESIQADQASEDVDPRILAILEQRHADFLANPQNVRTWTDVKASIQERYRGRGN